MHGGLGALTPVSFGRFAQARTKDTKGREVAQAARQRVQAHIRFARYSGHRIRGRGAMTASSIKHIRVIADTVSCGKRIVAAGLAHVGFGRRVS
jgi:hypothetical protein